MHPTIADHLVRDHIADLHREAHSQALARIASAGSADRRPAPAGSLAMPHVAEGGRLRRAIVALLRPSVA
jgi:hypothetical protein